MLDLPVHTLDTAPEESRDALERLTRDRGSIGNMFAVLAESPALLDGYLAMGDALSQRGTLKRGEQIVVMLAVSREHACKYCVPIYSRRAMELGLDPEVVRAIRTGDRIDDPRTAALRDLTVALVRGRGQAPLEVVESFLSAGFRQAELLEVIGGVALKTITNYVSQLVEVPLEDDLEMFAWSPSKTS